MGKLIVVIPFVHLLMYIAIGLDISILRQIIVFIYLSFIPGFVLLKTLRLKEISIVDTILFSVGLSIAFLMFVGLLINESYPIMGVAQPLSTIPLTVTLSLSTLVLFFVGYKEDLSDSLNLGEWNEIKLETVILRCLLFVFPPLLSIIGTLYVNIPILLLMIITIAALFALSVFSTRFIPAQLYPLMIVSVSLALVFQFSLISKHIIGYDAPLEYYVSKLTEISGRWRPIESNIYPAAVNYSSLLSITILPTIYSVLLNFDGEIIFKVFYPFIFSLVPLALYQIYEKQTWKWGALLSALFFISGSQVFYGVEPLSLNRQIIAEFFFVLSIFLLLDKKISTRKRRLLLIIFGASLIASHYSLAYLFLLYISFAFIVMKIKGDQDNVLNRTIVVLLFVITFSWYTYISISPLMSLSNFLSDLSFRFFTDLYNPAARSSDIFRSHPVLTIASRINWVFFYAAHFFVVLGILGVIFKARETRFDLKYRMITILSAIILFLCLALPNFAPSLNFERFYAITFLFLAPCFVLGSETFLRLSKSLWKKATGQHHPRNAHVRTGTLLVCTLLIGYFLSQSGFINRVTDASPQSYPLDLERMKTSNDLRQKISLYNAYHPEEEYISVTWLSKNAGNESKIYADFISVEHLLYDYGLIPMERLFFLSNSTATDTNTYVYLRGLNVVDEVVIPSPSEAYNLTEISPLLNKSNKIYSNGISEIYCSP